MSTDGSNKESPQLDPLELRKFTSVKVPQIDKVPGTLNDDQIAEEVGKAIEHERISNLPNIYPTRLTPRKVEDTGTKQEIPAPAPVTSAPKAK